LEVVLRVEVGVVDDARVGGRERNALAAGARRKQKDKGLVGGSTRFREAIDGELAFAVRDAAVDALAGVVGGSAEVLLVLVWEK